MHNFVFATLAGAGCLLATSSAWAGDADPRQVAAVDSFATLDRNADRRISRSEAGFDREMSRTFAELDTDGDGFVTIEEFTAAEQGRAASNDLTGDFTPR